VSAESDSLSDRCVVVAGATGTVGGWTARGLLERGATVIAVGRSAEHLSALSDAVDARHRERLHAVQADLSSTDRAQAAVSAIAAAGLRADAVVAALGRWWEGSRLLDLPMADWNTILTENLTAHFVAARTFAPILDDAADPSYITLAGIGALKAVEGSGAVSVTGAAQEMLLKVLAAESAGGAVRFHELLLTTPVVAPDDAATRAEHPDWILGPAVAGHVARILDHDFDPTVTLLQEPVPYVPRSVR
jgi:NADP-dependent 3-hydroxy acid dehydrogenase YdfG